MRQTQDPARIAQIAELVLSGLNRREISKWTAEKSGWQPASDETALDKIITAARALIRKRAAKHTDDQLSLAIERLQMIFARCMMINDYKAALSAEKELIQLLGLNGAAGRRGPARAGKDILNLRGSWRGKNGEEEKAGESTGDSLIRLG